MERKGGLIELVCNASEDIQAVTTQEILDPWKTAFIPVDLQYASACRTMGLGKIWKEQKKEALLKYRFDRIEQIVIPNVQKLLTFFRNHRLRIIHMTVGSEMPDYSDIMPHKVSFRKLLNNRVGEREHEILDEVKPLPGEMIINKTTTGAFNSSPIDSVLRAMGIEYCVFAGVSTDMCVEGTVRDAADRGYRVVLIEDGCAANRQEYHDASVSAIQRSYGRVCTTDQVIRELAASVKVRSS